MKAAAIITRIGAALLAAAGSAVAMANPQPWQLNMTEGVTETASRVYGLHMQVLWICVVIGVIVFGVMGVAMVRFRKSKGAVPAKWSHNTTAEIIWTVIPVLLLVAMAWPATKTLIFMADTSDSEMTVKVTGYQWMWRYQILNYKGESTSVNFVSRLDNTSDRTRQLGSGLDPADVRTGDENTYLLNVDNPLVLPTGTKIRFVITAGDVIHAWWVPNLGWKQDAIPGVVNQSWATIDKPGTYRGQCAELCGKDHGFMPIVVNAVSPQEFEQWLASQEAASTADATPVVAPSRG
ncbi:MAG: cytochrome c oxidase subunit II [Xanthomonadales bacterium]|nr:cytochrome c oxidase subunit II [Xanthomonadales bacterium]